MIGIPLCGQSVRIWKRWVEIIWDEVNLKHGKIIESAVLVSLATMCKPTQIEGPKPNRINLVTTLFVASVNRRLIIHREVCFHYVKAISKLILVGASITGSRIGVMICWLCSFVKFLSRLCWIIYAWQRSWRQGPQFLCSRQLVPGPASITGCWRKLAGEYQF